MSGTDISAGRDVILAGAGAVINRNRGLFVAIVIGLVLIAGGIGFLVYDSETAKLDAPRIRAHLIESSERKRDEELFAAGAAKTSAERERLRDAAEKADAARKARIADLVDSFVALDAKSETTSVFREMTRILSEEGVDAALAYVDKKRDLVLSRIQARAEAQHRQNRAELQPLLKAADLRAAKGETDSARVGYRNLLRLEPSWPDALESYGRFLIEQSAQSASDRTVGAALADAEEALADFKLLLAQDETEPKSQRLLSAGFVGCADILRLRGQPGDAGRALKYFTDGLEIAERLLKANPGSSHAARDVSLIFFRLGGFLEARGQPGDSDQALNYYTRSLEIGEGLLKANPDTAQFAREVSVGLNQLGDFLAVRGRPGDADRALNYYTRSFEIDERLLKGSPDSAEAARDLSVSLIKLGDFLAARGQPGDADQALGDYTRGLEIGEKLLKARPDSTGAARDVSTSLNRLGEILADRGRPGDSGQALKYYTRSLEIDEGLLKADPDSAQAARDVFVSLEKLGDFLAGRGQPGDADQALKDYSRGLEFSEGRMKADPDSAQNARDFSVGLSRLVDFLAGRGRPGDADQALKYCARSLEIDEGLLKAEPDSAQAGRDVIVGLEKFGNLIAARGQPGDADQAFEDYTRGLKIAEGLLKANSSSARAARDVSRIAFKLGGLLMARDRPGDADQALEDYRRSLELRESLLKAAPDSAKAAHDVFSSLEMTAVLLAMRDDPGDADQALRDYLRGLEIADGLFKSEPDSTQAAGNLSIGLKSLGDFLDAHGRPDEAKKYKRRASEIMAKIKADGAGTARP